MRSLWATLCLGLAAARSFPEVPSWATLPVFFHSSNESGLWNQDAAERIASFTLVTLEKSQGWNNASDTRPEEARVRDAAAQIKRINPNTTIFYYLNTLISWPFPSLALWLEANMEYALKNESGLPAQIRLSGEVTQLLLFDQGQAAMRSTWLADVQSQVDSGFFDGVFADRSHNFTNWGPEAKLSPSQQATWQTGHHELLASATQAMSAVNATFLENNRIAPGVRAAMIEDFGASEACIRVLQEADAEGVLVEAHAGDLEGGSDQYCANVTNSLAAFLIGAGERAYYACATAWTTNPSWPAVPDQWLDSRSEYARPLGKPTGPATKRGNVWERVFASGVAVAFDAVTNAGRITWSDGTLQQGVGPADQQGSCIWQTT